MGKCSNSTRGGVQLMTLRRFFAQSFSISSFCRLDMTYKNVERDVKHQIIIIITI